MVGGSTSLRWWSSAAWLLVTLGLPAHRRMSRKHEWFHCGSAGRYRRQTDDANRHRLSQLYRQHRAN